MIRESLDRFLPGRRLAMTALGLLAAFVIGIGIYWSIAPAPFNVNEVTAQRLGNTESKQVIGSTSAATLIEIAETLLEKPGGFLSNDIMPPGLYLDNIPNWEFGVLVQVRDFSRAFREDFSRSQSQSTEDADLIIAEPKFNFTNDSWLFPASESQYKEAIAALNSYLMRMVDADQSDAQFYARADNLASWLSNVESRLGSLSQRLSASVLQQRANTDMAGDPSATQSTPARAEVAVRTPWLEIDDVFFEARGATWALLHFLRAAEVDFAQVLDDKNAGASLDQIIRELEASQRSLGFPMVLNGSGFGMFANHSLTMANYVSRANAAIIDLRRLLSQG